MDKSSNCFQNMQRFSAPDKILLNQSSSGKKGLLLWLTVILRLLLPLTMDMIFQKFMPKTKVYIFKVCQIFIYFFSILPQSVPWCTHGQRKSVVKEHLNHCIVFGRQLVNFALVLVMQRFRWTLQVNCGINILYFFVIIYVLGFPLCKCDYYFILILM